MRFAGAQTVYGKDQGKIDITLQGEVKGDEITAEATDGTYVTPYRYTRLGDLR